MKLLSLVASFVEAGRINMTFKRQDMCEKLIRMLSDLDCLSTIGGGMPLTMSARFLPRPALNAQEPSTSAQVGGSSFFLLRFTLHLFANWLASIFLPRHARSLSWASCSRVMWRPSYEPTGNGVNQDRWGC